MTRGNELPNGPNSKLFFEIQAQAAEIAAAETEIIGLKASVLRRVKVLAEFSDEELRIFMGLMEVQRVSEGAMSLSKAILATPCISFSKASCGFA